jgi:hypothetical protein
MGDTITHIFSSLEELHLILKNPLAEESPLTLYEQGNVISDALSWIPPLLHPTLWIPFYARSQ